MSDTTTPTGLDTLSADEVALRDSMRDETEAPEIVVEAPVGIDDLDLDAPEAEPAADGRTKTVPHQQFHAANERRKQAEAKAAAAELKLATETAKTNERVAILMQAVQGAAAAPPAAPPAAEIPDVAVDPVGHFKALYENTQKAVQEQGAILRGFQEQQQRASAVRELQSWAIGQEETFMATEPTYKDAMAFLKASRHAELVAGGMANPADRERSIVADITQIALKAQEEGGNFAKRLYDIAGARGYAKKPAPNGAEIPPLDTDAALPAATARAERGRASAVGLGTAGAAPPTALSPERIAAMSEAQFDALVTKLRTSNPAGLRDLMGH